jgi:hypothetical protein
MTTTNLRHATTVILAISAFVSCVRECCGRTDVDDAAAAAAAADSPETVSIVYVEADGTEKAVEAEVGMNLMDVAHAHNVELEGTCVCGQSANDRRRRRREALEVVVT